MCAAHTLPRQILTTGAAVTKSAAKNAQNNAFRILFCHGLGSAKRDLIANQIQHWSNKRQIDLHNIEYRNYGNEKTVWNINDWKADILAELKRLSTLKANSNTEKDGIYNSESADSARTDDCGTILVCNSAASQALLRAVIDNEQSAEKIAPMPAGILMISPGVGMDVRAYMERLMPGSMPALEAGAMLDHPSADPAVRIRVNLACLEEFVNECPTRKSTSKIPIHCPVRIVHGIRDRLVPYRNSILLMDRLCAQDKALYLINDGHFIKDQNIINYALDSLWQTLNQQQEQQASRSQN